MKAGFYIGHGSISALIWLIKVIWFNQEESQLLSLALPPFLVLLLWGYTTAIITAHAPGQNIGQSPGQWPNTQVLQNIVHVTGQLHSKTLSAWDCHWLNSRGKKSREHSNVKHQCTDWFSATQNGEGAAESFSILLESNPSPFARLTATGLDH